MKALELLRPAANSGRERRGVRATCRRSEIGRSATAKDAGLLDRDSAFYWFDSRQGPRAARILERRQVARTPRRAERSLAAGFSRSFAFFGALNAAKRALNMRRNERGSFPKIGTRRVSGAPYQT